MPLPAYLLLVATLLPLLAFVLLLFGGKRLGTPIAGWVGSALIAASFACSLVAVIAWFQGGHYLQGDWGKGQLPIFLSVKWLSIGTAPYGNGVSQDHPGYLDLALYIDSLTVLLSAVMTLVALLVHLFAIGYMWREPRYSQFFAYLGLLCFSMLGLLISGSLLQIFMFWQLMGLCCFLLIGFWFERKDAGNAAMKFFISASVADSGFLIGFGILFCRFGNASLPDLWSYFLPAGFGQAVTLPGGIILGVPLLTAMGIALFCGAMGRSAQFPLHAWLADEPRSPTPASAIIHSVTMAAAGIYLVARLSPILTPTAKLFIAIIGLTTLLMGALIATAQSDFKRLLAFSTISQLGLIMVALGIGSWTAGLLHLINHAFFRSLLFLAAGSVIFAVRGPHDLSELGGLARKLPVTAVTFAVVRALLGRHPFLLGVSSQFTIVSQAGAYASYAQTSGRSPRFFLLFILPAAAACLTAFYITRCWMLVFAGKPRNPRIHQHAREHPMLWFPMGLLAILSVYGAKLLDAQPLLESSARESEAIVRDIQSKDDFFRGRPLLGAFRQAGPQEPTTDLAATTLADARIRGQAMANTWMRWAIAIGVVWGAAMYWNGFSIGRRMLAWAPCRAVHVWLSHRMYFDELYQSVFAGILLAASRCCAWFDRNVLEALLNRLLRARR